VRWLFPSLHGYRRGWLRGDLIAGLTMWAVLVPEALAYASIAGVSPVVGLYAAPGALILYAALGSSRQLIAGPMSATAALSAATVAALVPVGSDRFTAMTAALAITTGLAALLAGVLRLGFVASFISEPVIKGFIVGLALTIIIGQVPKLFGLEKGTGDFFQQLWHVIAHLGDTQTTTLLVGALSLAVILALRRLAPVVPGSLVAVLLGIVAVKVLHLDEHGVSIVGPIKSGLPSFGIPNVHLKDFGTLIAGGIGVMLVGFAEGLGAAKTYAAREHCEIDANRELLGLGGANVAAGLSSGMVVNGSLSKTAVLPGLFIGIGISLLLLIYRASRPYIAMLGREPGPDGRYSDIDRHPDNELPSHVAVLRIESSLYFANADAVRTRIMHAAAADGITAVVLDAETIPFIDVTAARMLATLAEDLDQRDVRLLLARDIGQVRDILRSVIDNPAVARHYPTVQAAVAAAQQRTEGVLLQ
jgi:anti-anti-sigma factor